MLRAHWFNSRTAFALLFCCHRHRSSHTAGTAQQRRVLRTRFVQSNTSSPTSSPIHVLSDLTSQNLSFPSFAPLICLASVEERLTSSTGDNFHIPIRPSSCSFLYLLIVFYTSSASSTSDFFSHHSLVFSTGIAWAHPPPLSASLPSI